jgi:hypothetical protein
MVRRRSQEGLDASLKESGSKKVKVLYQYLSRGTQENLKKPLRLLLLILLFYFELQIGFYGVAMVLL